MGSDRHHHHHHYYHRDAGRAGRPSPNPHRLSRSRTDRVLCGVCGGLADYLGWKAWHVRLLAILGLVVFTPATILAYIVACCVMKRAPVATRPADPTEADAQFWRTASTHPRVTFSQLRHTFRGLEGRIVEMERAVTNEEYRLNRAFREVEDQPRGSSR